MMKMKNMLIGGMSLALVACISVGATLAYLSAATGPVVNTFTMGDGIALELKEHIWADGENYDKGKWVVDNDDHTNWDNPTVWDKVNTYNDVVPGMVLPKDPTVKLASAPKSGAEVYVLVDGIDPEYMSVVINSDEWEPVTNQETTGQNGIYRYKGNNLVASNLIGEDGDKEQAYVEFFSDVTFEDQHWTTPPTDKSIVLYAFACQKDNGNLEDSEGNPTTPTKEAINVLNGKAGTNFVAKQ